MTARQGSCVNLLIPPPGRIAFRCSIDELEGEGAIYSEVASHVLRSDEVPSLQRRQASSLALDYPIAYSQAYYPLHISIPHQPAHLFKMVLKGHCLCKAVTYTVDVDQPLITGYDHCDDCQRQSGSTYCKFHNFAPSVLFCEFPEPLDLARSGWGEELGSFRHRHRGAGPGLGVPRPRKSYTWHTDGAKLLHDPCPR